MSDIELLRDLFDSKILSVIDLFVKHPEKQFYLTEISKMAEVNVSSTFRIVQKLLDSGIIRDTVIGKVRIYQLGSGDKALGISRMLQKKTVEKDPLAVFVDKLRVKSGVSRIIVESKTANKAKLMIIGTISDSELSPIIEDLRREFSFKIESVTISDIQYESLKLFKNFDLERKTVWEKK